MKALCVDDEVLLLDALKRAVEQSPDISSAAAFDDEIDALEWAKNNKFDIAFLDISMHRTGGLHLAEELQAINPEVNIIFCTGYREYAYEAIQLRASGYLIKPIRAEAVQKEIDHIKGRPAKNYLLTAQCFGSFEIYSHGIPLYFKRAKTKELLAYLIDRRGAGVSAREICAQLWEDGEDKSQNINYLHQLMSDLRSSLKLAGAESVLISRSQLYSVNTSLIDCDYYRFLEGKVDAKRKFTGEYMSNYSWSEYTCAYLTAKNI